MLQGYESIHSLSSSLDITYSYGKRESGVIQEIKTHPGYILLRRPGSTQLVGQIFVTKTRELEVLSEGRYFKNPYSWGWKIEKITDIPAGRLGVVTRLYGDDLAPNRILATDKTKGIVEEVLRPGKYRINPYAYAIQIYDAVNIRPGHAGVVVSLVGQDIFQYTDKTDVTEEFLVQVPS